MLRRRGVVLPAFDIYGGVSGLIDYGPVGAAIRRRLTQKWVDHWLSHGDIVEIDSPTITPESVLVASGHVGEFNDLMTECKACGSIFRADHLVEHLHPNADSLNSDEIDKLLSTGIECPSCSESVWTPAQPMNLMFSTTIGAMSTGRTAYMRPETAQGMFMLYPALYRHFRQKLPFGAIQTGKGYRNEISPRQGMIRLREFNMAELEYFIDPEVEPVHDFSAWNSEVTLIADGHGEVSMTLGQAVDKGVIRHPTVGYFMGWTMDFLISVGINPSGLRFRQHESTEMAHYAQDCWDAEILGSYGWIECVGIAHRGCYDLTAHENATGQRLRGWRTFDEPKVIEIDGWTIDGAKAGPAFRALAGKVKELSLIHI